jgi:RNA polymerase sigma-70 factor, ECF subfamily
MPFWFNTRMIAEPSQSLSELLRRARAGDARELDRLFAACRNYLCLIAQSHVEGRLKTKADASDLVQQTLLEAYRDFDQFRGGTEQEWLAWLRRILAHNAAHFIRHYRGTGKRQLGREVALEPATISGLGPADPGESPSQQLLRKERELLLADALVQLAPDYREVICLRNLQRLPFDEVAERMNRSRPAVQMLWMRALEKLQDLLVVLEDASSMAPEPGRSR